jgi:hypothetical protein
MPCSVRLNDCCRGEKTFLTMIYFLFNGAPGEHPVPEGFVTCPSYNPDWTGSLTDSVHGWRAAMEQGRTSTEGVPRWSGTASFDFPHCALQPCPGALSR